MGGNDLPFPTDPPVSGSSDMLLSSSMGPLSVQYAQYVDGLLRGGKFGAAVNQLSRTPVGSLSVYSEYVQWVNLTIQAFIFSGRYAVWLGCIVRFT